MKERTAISLALSLGSDDWIEQLDDGNMQHGNGTLTATVVPPAHLWAHKFHKCIRALRHTVPKGEK